MLVTLVIDPSALGRECLESSNDYLLQAELLFRGIHQNGLLLVDGKGLLAAKAAKNLSFLPTSISQNLMIWFEEIVKNRRVIKCGVYNESDLGSMEMCSIIQNQLNPDAVISSAENLGGVKETV